MTQTSIRGLLDQAHDLHAAISTALETVQNNNGPIQPLEWHELARAATTASLTADLLYDILKRELAADEPIPYTVADNGITTCTDPLHVCTVHPDGQHFMGVL